MCLQSLCAAGQWSDDVGRSTACTLPCDAGFYCPAGSAVSNPVECGRIDLYCPPGSDVPRTVPAGSYTAGGSPTTRTEAVPCDRGMYCPGDGLPYPCPRGRYGVPTGLSSPACTGACTEGYFCDFNSTSPTQGGGRMLVCCVACASGGRCQQRRVDVCRPVARCCADRWAGRRLRCCGPVLSEAHCRAAASPARLLLGAGICGRKEPLRR